MFIPFLLLLFYVWGWVGAVQAFLELLCLKQLPEPGQVDGSESNQKKMMLIKAKKFRDATQVDRDGANFFHPAFNPLLPQKCLLV